MAGYSPGNSDSSSSKVSIFCNLEGQHPTKRPELPGSPQAVPGPSTQGGCPICSWLWKAALSRKHYVRAETGVSRESVGTPPDSYPFSHNPGVHPGREQENSADICLNYHPPNLHDSLLRFKIPGISGWWVKMRFLFSTLLSQRK